MVRVTAEQLQKASGLVRAQARRAPVEVTYHGRPELVILSVEDYATLRLSRKIALKTADLPLEKLRRIAAAKMEPGAEDLDALMDD